MKKLGWILTSVLALGLLAFVLIPKKNKAAGETASSTDPYQFYYYPKLNAYYDFTNKDFVYSIDGGQNWQKKKPSSPSLPETLSEKVSLRLPVADAWRFNDEHRKTYNGIVYDFDQNEEPSARPPVRNEKQIEPVVVKTTSPEMEKPAEPLDQKPVIQQQRTPASTPKAQWEIELEQEAQRLLNKGIRRGMEELEIEPLAPQGEALPPIQAATSPSN